LTERFLHEDPPSPQQLKALSDELDRQLTAVKKPRGPHTLVGIAGTVTTLSAIHQGLAEYDGSKIQHSRLTLADVEGMRARLSGMTLEQRQHVTGLDPKRADVIVAGAAIVAAAMRHGDVDALSVSDRGVRWGVIWRHLARPR
jgi:exopolyphosphatase/guanosine-5'-triphosphate,3'-diphosphate pyrophosphatase